MDAEETGKLHQPEESEKLHNGPQPPQGPENQCDKPSTENKEDMFGSSWYLGGMAIMAFYVLFHFLNDYISSLAEFNVLILHSGFLFIFFTISFNIVNKPNWCGLFFSMACANTLLLFSAWVQQ